MGNLELLEEACARLPHTTRAMFGGHGLFAPNGGMFAGVVDDDRIMLKFAEETAREELVALGGEPWSYRETMTMKEWIVVPDRFYDEPRTLADWARRAHALVPPRKAKAGRGKGSGRGSVGPKTAKKAAKKRPPARRTRKR